MTTPASISFVKGLFLLLVLLAIHSLPEKRQQHQQ
jgi:hypothetical protein